MLLALVYSNVLNLHCWWYGYLAYRYCSGCKTHQKGKMTQRLYQLPDILVIHIKRFNMTARFREKIRAKVVYPLKGLDMSPFCAGGGDRATAPPPSVSEGNEIYDLYGVSNHIGGMNGGHYTAFVRFSSSTDIEFDDLCSGQVINISLLWMSSHVVGIVICRLHRWVEAKLLISRAASRVIWALLPQEGLAMPQKIR